MITFKSYQEATKNTAIYRAKEIGIPPDVYTALGLAGESGEVADKIKKFYRDDGDYHQTRESIKKELGDVLWYLSEHASVWGFTLEEIAEANLEKLASRRARNVIGGSGDDR